MSKGNNLDKIKTKVESTKDTKVKKSILKDIKQKGNGIVNK